MRGKWARDDVASLSDDQFSQWRYERIEERVELIGEGDDDLQLRPARDRDRILYSTAFRRLGGVTQTALATEDRFLLHNRLTHSIKVGQVGRRIAESLQGSARAPENAAMVRRKGGLHPEVVEAASLAHDLGHPPFGHVGEKELDALLTRDGVGDGYEGNAQSFRIVTKLSLLRDGLAGLNLTRATLNALQKYPWGHGASRALGKWGAYKSEEGELGWAREGLRLGATERTLEAEIMDWADDIAYAVHDLEDFLIARFIPLERISWPSEEEAPAVGVRLSGIARELRRFHSEQLSPPEVEDGIGYLADELGRLAVKLRDGRLATDLEELLNTVKKRWHPEPDDSPITDDQLRAAAQATVLLFGFEEQYNGSRQQRIHLRDTTSALVRRYIDGTGLGPRGLKVPIELRLQIAVLKQLTWRYVIQNPAFASQQEGLREIVRGVYESFNEAVAGKRHEILPIRLAEELSIHRARDRKGSLRLFADSIASMTDGQATRLYRRFQGIDAGQIYDPVF